MRISIWPLAATCAMLMTGGTSATANTVDPEISTVEIIYEAADSPWLNSQGQLTDNVKQLVGIIQSSVYHGLNPNNYHLKNIVALNRQLNEQSLDLQIRHSALAKLESTLDDAYYKLASHLGSGLVDGRNVQEDNFRTSPKPKLNSLYQEIVNGQKSVRTVFDQISPANTEYLSLQQVLKNLMHEKSNGLPRTQVPFAETVKLGWEHESVRAAKLRLLETTDFDGTSGIDFKLDELFSSAVKKFQERHHISPTGELNKKTITAMNRTVNDDITDVVVSLERWRWMPRELGFQRVIANIPDYRVKMYNGEQKIADMAVVVGKTENKTPLFSETIKHVVAAPTWTVPASITNEELVPLERENPGYLKNNNYELLKWRKGKMVVIPFSDVAKSDYYEEKFPYIIRQKAGKNNALGDVKILMPNKYAIYFHDTQAKSLFSKERRAYSHGCVRLQDPNRLASLIMQLDGVPQPRAQDFLASKKTKQYNLDSHIDSHMIYQTTFVDDKGNLNFRDDVYKYDNKVIQSLQNNSLLSILNGNKSQTLLSELDNIEQ